MIYLNHGASFILDDLVFLAEGNIIGPVTLSLHCQRISRNKFKFISKFHLTVFMLQSQGDSKFQN